MAIGDNAEMRDVQGRHEAEKRDVLQVCIARTRTLTFTSSSSR